MTPDEVEKRQPTAHECLELGRWIYEAKTEEDVVRLLNERTQDLSVIKQILEFVASADLLESEATSGSVETALSAFTAALGEEHRGRIRQIIDMMLELLGRTAEMLQPLVESDDLGERFAEALRDEHFFERARPVLVSMMCNLAAGAVVLDEATLPDAVKRSLVTHWFTSTQEMLAEVDPAQRVLDRFCAAIRARFPELVRVTYRKIDGIDGGVGYGVYLVLEDATSDARAVEIPAQVRMSWRQVSQLEQELRAVDEDMQGITWHIVNASEPGPIETILAA